MVVFYEENAKITEPRLSAESFKRVKSKLKVDPPYGELRGSIIRGKHIIYRAKAVGGKIRTRQFKA